MEGTTENLRRLAETLNDVFETSRYSESSIRRRWGRLSQYAFDDVRWAIKRYAEEQPDAMKLSWETLFRWLDSRRSDAPTSQHNDHNILLTQVRKEAKRQGVRADDMTDADAWFAYLRALTYNITHNTVTKRAYEDADGRLAALAEHARKTCVNHWLNYLKRNGIPVPGYMVL